MIGTAVAAVSGGDSFAEQSGDVERRADGTCLGHATRAGLEAAAEFTVRDLATADVIGSGTIESTSSLQVGENPPLWECRFHLRAELTRAAGEVGIQIDGLEEWRGRIEGGEIRVVIPNEVTSPKPSSTDPTEVSSSTEVRSSTDVRSSSEVTPSTESSPPAEE